MTELGETEETSADGRGKKSGEHSTYQQITDAILEQRLPPGTKLTEEVLGEIFGVSRAVIRRVLAKLSFENVVELRRNKGAVVATPSIQEAQQVFEARRLIETSILEAMDAPPSTLEVRKLRRLVEDENRSIEEGDRIAWIRLSGDFHIEIARLFGNGPMVRFLRELVAQTSLAIALYGQSGHSLCQKDDHMKIVDAIESGAFAEAAQLMSQHLEECVESLKMQDHPETEDLRVIFSNVQ